MLSLIPTLLQVRLITSKMKTVKPLIPIDKQERAWVIQRCINAWQNLYEDWPGYCENLMTRDEMMNALKECNEKWLNYEFRGHRVIFPDGKKEINIVIANR